MYHFQTTFTADWLKWADLWLLMVHLSSEAAGWCTPVGLDPCRSSAIMRPYVLSLGQTTQKCPHGEQSRIIIKSRICRTHRLLGKPKPAHRDDKTWLTNHIRMALAY